MPVRKEFFEIRNLPAIKGRAWIPLRQVTREDLNPLPTSVVAAETFTGIATAAVYSGKHEDVDGFGWSELGLSPHRSVMESWGYHCADIFRGWTEEPLGINLVIAQSLEDTGREVWHLHPDLVVALRLIQEGDRWYRPEEGWVEVIRLQRGADGEPTLVEIRGEFLLDYLSARNMELFCSTIVNGWSSAIAILPMDGQTANLTRCRAGTPWKQSPRRRATHTRRGIIGPGERYGAPSGSRLES